MFVNHSNSCINKYLKKTHSSNNTVVIKIFIPHFLIFLRLVAKSCKELIGVKIYLCRTSVIYKVGIGVATERSKLGMSVPDIKVFVIAKGDKSCDRDGRATSDQI